MQAALAIYACCTEKGLICYVSGRVASTSQLMCLKIFQPLAFVTVIRLQLLSCNQRCSYATRSLLSCKLLPQAAGLSDPSAAGCCS